MTNKLTNYLKQINTLQYTLNILEWTSQVDTAKSAVDDLNEVINEHEETLYNLLTSKDYLNCLDESLKNPSSDIEKQSLINLKEETLTLIKVPKEFYLKYTLLLNKSSNIWVLAKEKNDYNIFKDTLKEVIDMTKEYYSYLRKDESTLYDVALNYFEKGITAKQLDSLFESVKKSILPLIPKKAKYNDKLCIQYTSLELINCAKYLLNYIGLDTSKITLGSYPHGFTMKIGKNDVRIAFKNTTDPIDFITTIIHEGGHALFELNIDPNLYKYNNQIEHLNALHESQSRFYENILGRNINFYKPIYNDLKKMLKLDISLEEFNSRLNDAHVSLIRTQADELTYPLHIMIRYEIEKEIFNNNIDIDKLPALWSKLTKEYLGLDVEEDNAGILQDVHWSMGEFGYFPSYLLGSIYDGCLLAKMTQDLGNLDELLKNNQIKTITNYLITNIYRYGGLYSSKEIFNKLGISLDSKDIINYFNKKYK